MNEELMQSFRQRRHHQHSGWTRPRYAVHSGLGVTDTFDSRRAAGEYAAELNTFTWATVREVQE